MILQERATYFPDSLMYKSALLELWNCHLQRKSFLMLKKNSFSSATALSYICVYDFTLLAFVFSGFTTYYLVIFKI